MRPHLVLYGLILGLPLSGWIHDSAFKDAGRQSADDLRACPGSALPRSPACRRSRRNKCTRFWFGVHAYLAYILYAVFTLHVLGALKHQVLDGRAEFSRILPLKRAPEPVSEGGPGAA